MADEIDLAAIAQDALIARGLARVGADIPTGVAGDCDECGEWMSRLVDGRCGFCRDGRARPADWFDRHPVPTPEEKAIMTAKTTEKSRVISVPVKGALLDQIETLAGDLDLPLGQTVASLCETAFAAPASGTKPAVPQPVEWDGTRASAMIAVGNIPDVWLIEEVSRRLSSGVGSDDFAAAVARAEGAESRAAALETRLAQINDLLAG